ncbi:MAG: sigma factor G inhibitor Gin [Bacillota bacterium]
MAEMLYHRCIFCGQEGGYVDGLLLRGSFICRDCERNMLNSSCRDFVYSFYIKGLKKIWRCAGTWPAAW